MIRNRPRLLDCNPNYGTLPALPISFDPSQIPDLVKTSIMALGGLQPVTGEMAATAGEICGDQPPPALIEHYGQRGVRFQMVQVVANLAPLPPGAGATGVPYSLSIIPAMKRGIPQEMGVEAIAALDLEQLREMQFCYMSYDPFVGDWGLYGEIGLLLGNTPRLGHLDSVGLVLDRYFLATSYDAADVLQLGAGFDDPKASRKFNNHRNRLLFLPFDRVHARRIWGAESPIELFLFQALLNLGLKPILQMILYENGSVQPSLYDLWRAEKMGELPTPITDADLYFPDQRLAVFCDSTAHHRGKKRQGDAAISARLAKAGFRSVRVQGRTIVHDLRLAVDQVCTALEASA